MGFGAGALISAVAFDLSIEAFEGGGTGSFAGGLAMGAIVFFAGDRLLDRLSREKGDEPASEGTISQTAGPAIVLGVLLDGLPESIVLGASLLSGSGIGVSLVAAIFVSNLPEGLAGARDLSDEGHSRRWILGLWLSVALLSALAAAVGNVLLGGMSPEPVAIVQAFAAGAILAMLADTMMPEAFAKGGDLVGLATVLGFASAFLLSTSGPT